MESIYNVAKHFQMDGEIKEIIPWGNGLVNHTYRINTSGKCDYLLQQMNTYAYPDIDGMMQNIYMVTEALNSHKFYLADGTAKVNISVIPQKNGQIYYHTDDDCYFRVYNFIKDTSSIEKATTCENAYQAGVILGQFHDLLQNFPVEQLHMTVEDFHNPAKHYRNLLDAADADILGRLSEVRDELEFFKQYEPMYHYFEEAGKNHTLPLRVTHNDTKINNFMFANTTGESICMVDLDTIMPGYIATDFGDAIRSIMCTGKDTGIDTDCSKTEFRMDFYEAYRRGFLEWTGNFLTEEEIASLPVGTKLVCLESGMRYLADYLKGDLYLKIHYEKQNLIKTRMHIRLAQDMMKKLQG